MGDEGWVVGVANDDTGDAFGAAVGVEGVGFSCALGTTFAFIVRQVKSDGCSHFSSTSCLWPGRVRSATVLEKRDMNWP